MGTATGNPATIDSVVVLGSPDNSATSLDVPPISNVIAFAIPASCAAYKAPVTPPAGPDRIVVTGRNAAFSAEMIPPFDCITRTWTRNAAPFPYLPAHASITRDR